MAREAVNAPIALPTASASPDDNMDPGSLLDLEEEDDGYVSAEAAQSDDAADVAVVEPSSVEPAAADAEPAADAKPPSDEPPTAKISKFLKGKAKQWDVVSQREGKLVLLELPIDILGLIVKEITHTNDLTSLALTNSALYDLAIPHIYARFDIVWPDAHTTTSDGKSVDALTYGLSTLCLGSTFARTNHRLRQQGFIGPSTTPVPRAPKFGGANYAKFTRKFSLGNGPSDWVVEYMITKESGKMLGTLVALAVAKMVNLETFIWDMPTGVLSDIFMALASLPYNEGHDCKLERLWIRWHDNNDTSSAASSTASPVTPAPQHAVVPLGSALTQIGILLPSNAVHPKPRATIPYSQSTVEYPTFSVVPPLKSLTVLDIDELAYLDEMSILIERSKDKLQELRVGISSKALHKDFVQIWDGTDLHQVDHIARWPGESTIGDRRLGGVLGVLVGRVYDIRRKVSGKAKDKATVSTEPQAEPEPVPQGQEEGSGATQEPTPPAEPMPTDNSDENAAEPAQVPAEAEQPPTNAASSSQSPVTTTAPPPPPPAVASASTPQSPPRVFVEVNDLKASRATEPSVLDDKEESSGRKRLEGKLRLQTLELERIPLSMHVCGKAIDWTALTNLTILDCAQHENLWKMLKRQFAPTPTSAGFGISSSRVTTTTLQYHLNIKRIHADVTSAPLIAFIKETLAPNSLEILFLQDRRRASGPPPVTLNQIFKGALKRHRTSLQKLLLDSSHPKNVEGSTRWRHWVLSTEILLYITSGRMAKLRELAVALRYQDWHTFLRRLENIPQLRSLNIPYLSEHLQQSYEPKELALQIADIITLRPEIQLCYIGISTKCFEMLEARGGSGGAHSDDGSAAFLAVDEPAAAGDTTDDDEDDDDDDDDEGTETDDEGTATSPTDPDETQSEEEDGGVSDDDSFVEESRLVRDLRLRLREILFYDDKVAIFKARHGRL